MRHLTIRLTHRKLDVYEITGTSRTSLAVLTLSGPELFDPFLQLLSSSILALRTSLENEPASDGRKLDVYEITGGLERLGIDHKGSVTDLLVCSPALEATQVRIDGFFSQLPYKCHLEEVAFVGDWPKVCPHLNSTRACSGWVSTTKGASPTCWYALRQSSHAGIILALIKIHKNMVNKRGFFVFITLESRVE